MTTLPQDSDGKLSAYAWPGGYQLIYVTRGGLTVCPDCANEETSDPPTDVEVYWEGPDLTCEDCGKPIPSAYGDPEDDHQAQG